MYKYIYIYWWVRSDGCLIQVWTQAANLHAEKDAVFPIRWTLTRVMFSVISLKTPTKSYGSFQHTKCCLSSPDIRQHTLEDNSPTIFRSLCSAFLLRLTECPTNFEFAPLHLKAIRSTGFLLKRKLTLACAMMNWDCIRRMYIHNLVSLA